jgi:uncharacterized membrane protein YphA (DoxX/SURF4 family)
MKYLPAVARILMGLTFFVFGLNGFLQFIPKPTTPMPDGAMAFFGALLNTRYMIPLVAGTQLLVGVLLLINLFVPLALVLIAPVLVNIILFHIFLDLPGIVPGTIATVLEIFLVWAYRNAYRAMVAPRAKPAT